MKLLHDRSGAAASEYALVLALIGVAIIGAALFLSGEIGGVMTSTGDCIDTQGASC